jgi:hypothetical protein
MFKLQKLTPDQDLQCYFRRPSAVAALSQTSAGGFTVSGCWREQFDWAVVEWNRDNVFEHPVFRNLPDGDLSGLKLSYEDTRVNCIALDSSLFATVDWPYLRVWADPGSGERIYWIPLRDHATAVDGSYTPASATFELQGTPTGGGYIELAWDQEHYTYQLYGTDTLVSAAAALANSISTFSKTMKATADGTKITLTLIDSTTGVNGNRIGVYGNVHRNVTGNPTESWQPAWRLLSGGKSPDRWRIDLDFTSIQGHQDSSTGPVVNVPMNAVRKIRWTWAADLQPGGFARSEFAAAISNWAVSGSNRDYQVAGLGSWRVEDADSALKYTGKWTTSRGNFSGGSIGYATAPGASVTYSYQSPQSHHLYLGTRRAASCTWIAIQVDRNAPQTINLLLDGEDVLVRLDLGELAPNVTHTVTITHAGDDGTYFYFDFLEMAVPSGDVPTFVADSQITLATDWDTDHSLALAPERTARLIQSLGFTGRANYYTGALWFYELCCPGQQYAMATITFSGAAEFGKTTEISVDGWPFRHVNLIGDTPASLATAFALQVNEGSTGVWAQAQDAVLTFTARAMGSAGNGLAITADTGGSTTLNAEVSGALAGGVDAAWLTDMAAVPRINRAARDWSQSFYAALDSYGIDLTASFSMELGNGDPSSDAGIAQCYPDGSPCMVNTPALQTNFSPASTAFWQQVYLDMADVMAEAGLKPYLQFGEVQWWYFCPPTDPANGNWTPLKNGGMPFYDAYTTGAFQSQYKQPIHVFTDPADDPTAYPDESVFLPGLIGQFTTAIMDFVRQKHTDARFEVLYPPDTNDAPLTRVINLPGTWSPANLDCFKTENFTYTGDRDLDKARTSIALPVQLGFSPAKSAHLVGIGDYSTPWTKESQLAKGQKVGSIVLFALDQMCLVGYGLPLKAKSGRSLFMGA